MTWITDPEYDKQMRKEIHSMRYEVRQMMREKNLRINAVSKGTGIAFCAVRDFVKGARVPSYKTISRIRYFVRRYQPVRKQK